MMMVVMTSACAFRAMLMMVFMMMSALTFVVVVVMMTVFIMLIFMVMMSVVLVVMTFLLLDLLDWLLDFLDPCCGGGYFSEIKQMGIDYAFDVNVGIVTLDDPCPRIDSLYYCTDSASLFGCDF